MGSFGKTSGSVDVFGTFLRKEPVELRLNQFLAMIQVLVTLQKESKPVAIAGLEERSGLSSREFRYFLQLMQEWGLVLLGSSGETAMISPTGRSIVGSIKEMVNA